MTAQKSSSTCAFCHLDATIIVAQTPQLVAFYDKYPVTKGHVLIVPKAHREDYFALTELESRELYEILHRLKNKLQEDDPSIAGFNIGMNCGRAAGQTVFHCHVHLIPRRENDVQDPRGGVRGVIASKQKYD